MRLQRKDEGINVERNSHTHGDRLMIVLHVGASQGQLFLWGEVPVDEQAPAVRKRKKQQDIGALPYSAGAEKILIALAEAGITFTTDKRGSEALAVWLPTVDKSPVASSPLVAEPPPSLTNTVLAPWTITALPLTMPQAVDLLCACIGKPMLAPGVILGSDVAFWTTVVRFAGVLVTQQQFLPQLAEEQGTYRACWKPVFVGPINEVFVKLAQGMPQVCRALTREALSPSAAPASEVLSGVIAEMVDLLVRSSTAGVDLGLKARPTGGRQTSKKMPAFVSIHDQWLYHLRSTDGTMKTDPEALAQLTGQIREWQRQIAVSTATPFRLCFRLEEPNADEESVYSGRSSRDVWYVRYLLQAADDPSLLIEAKDAWNQKGDKAALLKRNGFNVREYLLSSLGQVTGICPPVETSLKTTAPGGYELDATGAYQFLTEYAQVLELAGFGVLLPAWWTRKGTKLRLTVRAEVKSPKLRGNSGLSLDTIAQFQWQVALGDEQLTLEELQALAKLKQPLVQVRGQWVQMNAEEIQAALDFWKKKATNQATVREVVRMALGAGQTPGGMGFEGVTADGWIADFLAQLDGRTTFEELSTPQGFQGTLRPYQLRGYSWLGFLRRWGLGACLADDMGLGKTVQTLGLIQRDWESNGKRPVLLICPTSVVGNWRKEAARFTPDLPVMVHHGLTRTKSAAFIKEAPATGHGTLQLRTALSRLRDLQASAVGWCRS